LIAHWRRFLANYKIPRRIEFSETELPKSGTGKVMKRLLRERFGDMTNAPCWEGLVEGKGIVKRERRQDTDEARG